MSAPLPTEEVVRGIFYSWSLLRKDNMATMFSKSSLEVTAVDVLLHVSVERRHLRRKCIKTVTADSGKPFQSRVHHFFAKFEKFATQ